MPKASSKDKVELIPQDIFRDILEDILARCDDRLDLRALRLAKERKSKKFLNEAVFAQGWCIKLAVGEYADWISQFAFSRKKYLVETIGASLINESIAMGELLTGWGVFLYSHESAFDKIKTQTQLKRLESLLNKELVEWRNDWVLEAERKVYLRRLLSKETTTNASPILEDRTKQMIQFIILDNGKIDTPKIFELMDEFNAQSGGQFPPPETWKTSSMNRPWVTAFELKPLRGRIKTYLSRIRGAIPPPLKPLLISYRGYLSFKRKAS